MASGLDPWLEERRFYHTQYEIEYAAYQRLVATPQRYRSAGEVVKKWHHLKMYRALAQGDKAAAKRALADYHTWYYHQIKDNKSFRQWEKRRAWLQMRRYTADASAG